MIYHSIKWIFTQLLNLLFPIRHNRRQNTGSSYESYIVSKNIYLHTRNTYTHQGVYYTLRYKEPSVKKLIWKFKYYLNPQALRACTYILYDQLIADASDRVSQIPFQRPYVLLHYPSSTYFNNKKSFDHMKELTLLIDKLQSHPTTEISAFEGSTFESSIFRGSTFFTCCIHAILPNKVLSSSVDIDNGQTSIKAQHTGSRADRFKWSKERFVISNTFETYITNRPETRHIYCIDDIVTTGASMQAVSDMFNNKFGLKVKKFCIGH